jgi:hypothetical protein
MKKEGENLKKLEMPKNPKIPVKPPCPVHASNF